MAVSFCGVSSLVAVDEPRPLDDDANPVPGCAVLWRPVAKVLPTGGHLADRPEPPRFWTDALLLIEW